MLQLILRIVVPLTIIIATFIYNVFAGLLAIILFIVYLIYNARADLYAMRSNKKWSEGKIDEARLFAKKAFETKPLDPALAIRYGYSLIRFNDFEQAEAILTNVSEKKLGRESLMSLRLNKAILYWKQGREEESLDIALKLQEDYTNSILYGTLGYLLVIKGDLEKALSYNLEAYEYNDTNTAILDNIGLTYYKLAQYDKALEIYEKLIPLNPSFREAHFNYGLVLENNNQVELALEQYKIALTKKGSLVSHVPFESIEEKVKQLEVIDQVET